jgi:heme-degrading monooxygenase HmoA
MFAVIFEVRPRRERWDDYLALAKRLKPEIERIEGFIDNERFASRGSAGLLLSLSTWRDEKSVVRWRTLGIHHETQAKGRSEIFEDYHLRVGEITADSQIPAGQTLRSQRLDETETGAAKMVTICELTPASPKAPASSKGTKDLDLAALLDLPAAGSDGLLAQDVFDSIYVEGKALLLASWRDAAAAERWQPRDPGLGSLRHRRVRIVRDYGMFDRREAPQFYPPVERR